MHSLILIRIQSLSVQKKVPVYAFVEDVAASGGYFLACGAKEIYASESSIVGSIGVISQSFGFQVGRHFVMVRIVFRWKSVLVQNRYPRDPLTMASTFLILRRSSSVGD